MICLGLLDLIIFDSDLVLVAKPFGLLLHQLGEIAVNVDGVEQELHTDLEHRPVRVVNVGVRALLRQVEYCSHRCRVALMI